MFISPLGINVKSLLLIAASRFQRNYYYYQIAIVRYTTFWRERPHKNHATNLNSPFIANRLLTRTPNIDTNSQYIRADAFQPVNFCAFDPMIIVASNDQLISS